MQIAKAVRDFVVNEIVMEIVAIAKDGVAKWRTRKALKQAIKIMKKYPGEWFSESYLIELTNPPDVLAFSKMLERKSKSIILLNTIEKDDYRPRYRYDRNMALFRKVVIITVTAILFWKALVFIVDWLYPV